MKKNIINIILLSVGIIHPSCTQRGAFPQSEARGSFASGIQTLRRNSTGTTLINQPGAYILSQDFFFSSTLDDSLITIACDNVHLDLNSRTLYIPHDTDASIIVDGIIIKKTCSNIIIKNGNINDITGVGIKIEKDCFNIRFENLTISKSNQGGIFFDTGSQACFLSNCFIGSCNSINTDALGISLNNVQDINMNSCSFISNIAPTGYNSYGISIKDSINCSFSNIESNNNIGDSAIGICVDSSSNCTFDNCETNYNTARVGSCCGFKLNNSATTMLTNCSALSNRGKTNAAGIHLLGNCACNRFKDCITACQKSTGDGNAFGFLSVDGIRNFFNECESFGNQGGTGKESLGVGIYFDTEKNTTLTYSKSDYNNGNTGKGYGLFMSNTKHCVIKNNSFFQNTGESESWGIYEADNSTSYIVKNEAFGNTHNYSVPLSFGQFKYQSRQINDTDELPDLNANDNLSIDSIQ